MEANNNLINVQLNMFGPILSNEQLCKLLDPDNNEASVQHSRLLLDCFFAGDRWRVKEVLERYVKVGSEEYYISIVPHTNEMHNNISRPLCSAKRLFCLGEFLATIGLSGIVGEMLAMLIWEVNKEKVYMSDGKISVEQEKLLFGRKIEKQGQERRVEILSCLGFISPDHKLAFDRIRNVRRQYLHFWDVNIKATEEADAEKCLRDAFFLYKSVLNLRINQGQVAYDDAILKYARNNKPI